MSMTGHINTVGDASASQAAENGTPPFGVTFTEGIQCLREYIYYNNYNFLKACSQIDQYDRGYLTFEQLKALFAESHIKFPVPYINDVYQNGVRNKIGDLKYKELNIKIRDAGPPDTIISILLQKSQEALNMDKKGTPIRIEDYQTYLKPKRNILDHMKQSDFQNFGLDKVDASLLEDLDRMDSMKNEVRLIEVHNTQSMLHNFPIKLSQKILQTATAGNPDIPESVKAEYIYRSFGMKTSEMYRIVTGAELQKVIDRAVGVYLTEGEILYLLHLVFNSKVDIGLTYKALIKNILVVIDIIQYWSVQPTKAIVDFSPGVLDSTKRSKVGYAEGVQELHLVSFAAIVNRTLPLQPRAIQEALELSMRDSPQLGFETFKEVVRNLGVEITVGEERLLKELLIERKVMRLDKDTQGVPMVSCA